VPSVVWSGVITFGLVNVPVQLVSAVRDRSVRFRTLAPESKQPIKQIRTDPDTGDEVPYRETLKGYEVDDGRYLIVEREELQALAPRATRAIDLLDVVELSQIDPIYFDRAYHLVPDGEQARKPYRLLAEALARSGRVGIARFVLRDKEHLAAVRAAEGRLLLSTMHHHDEVTETAALPEDAFAGDVELTDRELTMAEQLIESMTTSFDPSAYPDEHRQRVLEFLEAKASGDEAGFSTQEDDRAEVIDLVTALERSLAASGGAGDDGGGADGEADGDQGAAGAASSGATDSVPAQEDELDAMSREELYELAQQRELPGRSSMSKKQLIAALRAEQESGAA
jgi:DNA end-binding protein Ku